MLASVPRGSPFHYGRLCVVEGAPIADGAGGAAGRCRYPSRAAVSAPGSGARATILISAAGRAARSARRLLFVLYQMRAMAMRISHAPWGHRRPVTRRSLGAGR